MWLKKVRMVNFRSVEDQTVSFTPGINAIFGPNGTGKTNITRAILKLLGPSYPGQNSFSAEDHTLRDESRQIEIELTFEDAGSERSLYWGPDNRGKCRLQIDGGGYLNDREREAFCPLHFPSNRSVFEFPGQNKWNPVGRIIHELADLVGNNSTFMSDFGTRVRDLNASLESAPEYRTFREKLIEYSRDHLGARGETIEVQLGLVDPRHILKTLQVFETDGNAFYNVAEGGQGVQSSVTIAALRAFAAIQGGRFFIIADEPEAFLHPLAQQAISSVFGELARGGTQILLTTHSPHFIIANQIEGLHKVWMENNRTKSCPFDMDGLLQRREERGTERGTAEGIRGRLSKILTLEAREALFAQVAILCEGETEALSLPIWADILGHDFSKLGIAMVQAQGKFSMTSLADFYGSFSLPTFVVFDSDNDVTRAEDRTKHAMHNRFLLRFAGARLEDFPRSCASRRHAVFAPKYERVMREDPNYPQMESLVNSEWGLDSDGYKGIRARGVAMKYRELNLQPPPMIVELVRAVLSFRQSVPSTGAAVVSPVGTTDQGSSSRVVDGG
jgi:putative ATP-dependent endonuclease of OLD family